MTTPSSPEIHKQPPASLSAQYPLERTDSDPDVHHTHSSRTPSSASVDVPLLPDGQPRTPRSHTVSPNFVSSPLNPNAFTHSPGLPSLSVGSRAQSRQNMVFNRIASEESQALTTTQPTSLTSNRASMILYRLAGEEEQRVLTPPGVNRQSVLSNSGDSVFTVSYDSKYPSGAHTPHKLVPYPFDPSLHINTPEDDDALHDPSDNSVDPSSGIPIRGLVNVGVLVLVILALLCLFIFYPIWHYTVQGNSPDQ
ncbi:hypothetical protein V8E55_008140 [Tylopilus felleus]